MVNYETICDKCMASEANIASANPVEYVCFGCAADMGWDWPTDHTSSSANGECDVCGELRQVTHWTEWETGGADEAV
jgi:hypothetical protein